MRPSTTRFLNGLIVVAALGCGGVRAEADNANGPNAGIGIPGYSLDYDHPANGSGPAITQPHYRYNDGLPRGAAGLASDFNFSPSQGEITSALASIISGPFGDEFCGSV
jgi:hypothetical protein